MNIAFSEPEIFEDGKTINVLVDGTITRVELHRSADKSGNAGWDVFDCVGVDRKTIESDMSLPVAKRCATEYLIELDARGASVYFAEQEDDTSPDAESGDATGEEADIADSGTPKPFVDAIGQSRLFGPADGVPMDDDYTDERHERIVARYEKAKTSKADTDEEKKRIGLISKMEDADYHHARIERLIDDARIDSLKQPKRALVPINHMAKFQVVYASDVHIYNYNISETKFYQAFVNGNPVSLDEAKEIDLAAKKAAGEYVPSAEPTKTEEAVAEPAEHEREYRCPHFPNIVPAQAVNQEEAMSVMQCSPDDDNSGCFSRKCSGPVAEESDEPVSEEEAGELLDFEEGSEGGGTEEEAV